MHIKRQQESIFILEMAENQSCLYNDTTVFSKGFYYSIQWSVAKLP